MKPETRARKQAAAANRRRGGTYGVQVRLSGGQWAWIKPNTTPTLKPMEAATWTGPDAQQSALEAALTLSTRVPSATFRTARI